MWVSPSPAISQSPGGQLYGWLPLSNAYGISSIATQHKSNNNSIPYVVSQSPNLTAECAPERGNEPPAQGSAVGNKGYITGGALTGQKRYRWEENAFAPPGRNHHTAYNTQGVALGYMIVGLSGRHSTDVV